MDILNQIIEKLNKEEIRKYKSLSPATADRKDHILFDYIRASGSKFDEGKALKKLDYTDVPKNRYYQLKNRLIENIGDSLVLLNTHKDELYEVHQYIQLYHMYRSRNLLKVALTYLHKAERGAKAIDYYEIQDVIYNELIRLCSDMPDLDPALYIARRDENAKIVADLREMDNALATLSYRLRASQNFGPVDTKLLQKLQSKVSAISTHTTARFGRNLEARIYTALSRILVQQHHYDTLETLATDTYRRFEKEKWFDRGNHELKLQMLTYSANALFKNKKYKDSIAYATLLGKEIEAYDKLHFDKYYFFYCNSLVNNYTFVDPQKGLTVLNEFEATTKRRKTPYYDIYIYLNRATLLAHMKRHKESLQNLVKLYLSDSYKSTDLTFKLKIEVSELIITFETGDTEVLDYRLKQVKKTFASLSKEKTLQRDFQILRLLQDMNADPDYRSDARIRAKVTTFLNEKQALEEEDSEIIQYRPWLRDKFSIS